jgi:hypothetical protein
MVRGSPRGGVILSLRSQSSESKFLDSYRNRVYKERLRNGEALIGVPRLAMALQQRTLSGRSPDKSSTRDISATALTAAREIVRDIRRAIRPRSLEGVRARSQLLSYQGSNGHVRVRCRARGCDDFCSGLPTLSGSGLHLVKLAFAVNIPVDVSR